MTGFPRHRMKIREERVFIEGSNVDRTFLETLKQVKRDDFVSLRTAIEDHQSNYFFLLCYIFFSSWDMENTLPCSDRQKWKPPSKSTRGPSWSRNIKYCGDEWNIVSAQVIPGTRHPNSTYNNCGGHRSGDCRLWSFR